LERESAAGPTWTDDQQINSLLLLEVFYSSTRLSYSGTKRLSSSCS
jgi:hypothetical protein